MVVGFRKGCVGEGGRHLEQVFIQTKNSNMHVTTVANDLAKSVFQLAVVHEHWRIVETQRLTRLQFERWVANRSVDFGVR